MPVAGAELPPAAGFALAVEADDMWDDFSVAEERSATIAFQDRPTCPHVCVAVIARTLGVSCLHVCFVS